jgi:ribosomal protein S27E
MAEEVVVLENLDETDVREQFRYMAQLQAAARVKQRTGYDGHAVTTRAARHNKGMLDDTTKHKLPPSRPSHGILLLSEHPGPVAAAAAAGSTNTSTNPNAAGNHANGRTEEPSMPNPRVRSGRESNSLPPHLLALQHQVTLTDNSTTHPQDHPPDSATAATDDEPDPNSIYATVACLNCDSQLRFPKQFTLVVCPNCQTVSPGSSISNFPS